MLSAAKLAHALGGHRVGRHWIAKCPAHQDRTPSLSIAESDDGKALVYCHAGCGQAQVIAALRDRGLWTNGDRHHDRKIRQHGHQFAHDLTDRDDAKRTAVALGIWHEARPGAETIVGTYLRSRGISLDPLPRGLRFHPQCWRPRGDAGNRVSPLPAMVALVEHIERGPVAIHRTYLRANGHGKARIEPAKASLGPVAGGAVRFGMPREGEWLAIAEGIESALSLATAYALPCWAALSANGIKSLVLPPEASMVLICADNDVSDTGQRAAYDAAERFLREGRRVRVAIPPEVGTDFNDLLCSAAPNNVQGEARDVA